MRFGGKLFIQRGRLTLLALVLLSVILQFQNCGKKPGSAAALHLHLSPDSPFFDQRVRLDLPQEDSVNKASSEIDSEESDSKDEEMNPQKIVVLLHNGCAADACSISDEKSSSLACEILNKKQIIKGLESEIQAYSWNLEKPESSKSFEQILRSNTIDDQCIAGVSFEYSYKTESYTTNDTGFTSQYFHDTLNGADAYDFFYKQKLSSIYVGVIDSGLDSSHEDSGNGYNINLSESCTSICNNHGNHVSGIINGRRNNGKGGHGIAPNAYIYSFQVGTQYGSIPSSEIVNALQMAKNYNLDIINMSLGGPSHFDFAVQDGIISNIIKGTLVVIAAGNNGSDMTKRPFYPASYNFDGQINVAAASPVGTLTQKTYSNGVKYEVSSTLPLNQNQLDSHIKLDGFSNYSGSLVHIAAPGTNIYSNLLNNTYGAQNGTSFAAPMVTGALALIKGYLKANGYDTSPQLLKTILLEGSTSVDSLSFVNETGETIMPVQNNRYLDLKKLKETVQHFIEQNQSSPAEVSLVSSTVKEVNGKKQVHIRVDVRDGDLNQELVLRAFTNSAFLTESFTGYSCNIQSARQVCDIIIDYDQLYRDPEVYLMVTDKDGKTISDFHIPKTAINFGDKTKANIKGEIIGAYYFNDNFEIEGWACLEGFPDSLEIQIRVNNKTAGTASAYITTNRQARGNYFQECNSAEITLGFRYVVPKSWINNSASYKLYFRAVHPETGKSLDLPVFTHQPTYEDGQPATFVDHVHIDKNLADRDIDIKITKKEFKNFILTLEGSACYRNSYRPGAFTLGLNSEDIYKLFPAFRNSFPNGGIEQVPSTLQGTSVKSFKRSFSTINPRPRRIDNLGWIGSQKDHSDIYNQFLFDASPTGPQKGFLLSMDDLMRIQSGFLTVTPDIELNDGCRYPSGFKIVADIRPYIKSISSSISITYRGDVYTEDQILAIPAIAAHTQLLSLPSGDNNYDFANLFFDPTAFNFYIETTFDSERKKIFLDEKIFTRNIWQLHHNYLVNQRSMVDGFVDWIDKSESRNQVSTNSMKHNYKTVSLSNELRHPVDSKLWEDAMTVVIGESSNLTLSSVYNSPVLSRKREMNTIFAKIEFDEGQKFGELNEDFKLQARFSSDGPWYDLPLIETSFNSDHKKGLLQSTYNTGSVSSSTVEFRILANGKNQLRIVSFGYVTE